ncbi:MAG: DUF1553 domain-containing protein, partial [Planctomycetales bacterium]|nr:DUF1553 domain-containing protein [Planctomycetales bacterium]
LNDPFFHEQATNIAAQAKSSVGVSASDEVRVRWFFQRILQRDPTADELALALQFLQDYPAPPDKNLAAYVRILLASNEFLHVD